MFKKLFSIIFGTTTALFSSLALMTHNGELLVSPSIQIMLGLATGSTVVNGISAFHKKQKGIGLFFTFITLFLLTVILLNNTMTTEGIIPVLTVYIIFGVPIGIIAMLEQRIHTRSEC
ncbi:hypothetical protein Q7A53_07150 [Halobacillus rhizosphaerae]|uniref:hypothetical protein n=1 Tax=Halobacillus rhizosphaerae TaxID=3064889 RepID=UPI00398AB9CD